MSKKGKIYLPVQLLLVFIFTMLSMAWGQEQGLTVVSQPTAINIVPKNQSATLSFSAENGENEITYQWYQSTDGTTETGSAIDGATEETLVTETFTDKEIRYYYCIATDGVESVTSNVVAAAYTGLPALYVNTPEGVEITSKEIWTENASLTLANAENEKWNFENVSTSIRGRGNTTWSQRKKPYALKLDKKQEIMGMPKHKRWVLIANYLDNSFIKNHMAFYLSQKLEMDYTVKGRYVDLFFNGVYRGLYWLGEAIKVDEGRVNINDGKKKMTDEEDKDYLIEMDVNYDEPVKFRTSVRNMPYMIKNDDYMIDDDNVLTSGGSARLERLQMKINALENLLYPDFEKDMNTNDCSAPNEIYTNIIDVDSWAKYWLVNEMMGNGELGWPKSAYFTYDSKDNTFKAGPVWDFDWSLLSKQTSIHDKNVIYYNALFKSPLFIVAIKRVWENYSSTIDVNTEVENMRDYLKTAAVVDSLRWGVHLDPSNVERDNFDAYVDFVQEALNSKINVVDKYVMETLPQITVVSPTIALSSESFEYNGLENKPSVIVTDENNALTEGTDYTISYYDNVNAGTGKVVFAAKGNYAGVQEKTFTISPKTVSLTVANASKIYGQKDPEFSYTAEGLVSVDGAEVELDGVEISREAGEDAGEYAVTATVDGEANPNYAVTKTDGVLTINPDDTKIVVAVKGHKDIVEYNGQNQTVRGFDMTSSNDAYSLKFVTYAGDSVAAGTDAKTYSMGLAVKDFNNTSVNYSNVVFEVTDGNLTISPKPVALTVANASKTYGQKDPEFSYTIEGLVSVDGVEEKLNGVEISREAGEDAGEYAVAATVDDEANPNYAVTKTDGVLTINPDDTKIVVAVKGHKDVVEYNGQKQAVYGFDMTSSNEAYSLNFVNYAGDSVAAGTNADTYSMGLVAKDFNNTSVNYSNVVFEVTDGNLTISPKPVALTVANASKTYGQKDPEFSYTTEGLVSVDGVEEKLNGVKVSREAGEDAGKYGIAATVDADANPNYVVTKNDGVLTINPDDTKIVVTIKGHKDTVEYNGKKQSVHGFDMTSNNDAYSLEFVAYAGDSVATGKDAKSYSMGLTAKDFKNTSVNYSNVVFEITDGNLTIKSKPKKDALLASRVNVNNLNISTVDRRVQINGATVGDRFAIFDMQGNIVREGFIMSADFEISILKAGVYVARIGSMVQRIRIR